MSKCEFRVLEGWKTVAYVADSLGVSRQAVHKMLFSGVFNEDDVRQVGSEIKPLYLIRDEVLDSLLKKRAQDDTE